MNVKLEDNNFPEGSFEYASGYKAVAWPKIAPGSNVTHTVIVRPKTIGMFTFTSATVSYLPNDKTDRVQVRYFLFLFICSFNFI